MKSNINREETESKKKYVFFSDPDVIVRRAESTAAVRFLFYSISTSGCNLYLNFMLSHFLTFFSGIAGPSELANS